MFNKKCLSQRLNVVRLINVQKTFVLISQIEIVSYKKSKSLSCFQVITKSSEKENVILYEIHKDII